MTYYCPKCPYTCDRYDRLATHYGTIHILADVSSDSDDIMEEDILQAVAEDFQAPADEQLQITEPIIATLDERQKITFELMTLHRLWRVPRWQLIQILELAQKAAAKDEMIRYADIRAFENSFKSNGYCLTPHPWYIDTNFAGRAQRIKIGFITIKDHIRRCFSIPEYSRKLQTWQASRAVNVNSMHDLHDLPRFTENPIMQQDARNLLLLFYVDKVCRNRQVNLTWKNVWVLRCIPVSLGKAYRADMANWWDLAFIPGFLLKEKGVNFFMERFVDELKDLRVNGIQVVDAFKSEQFLCKADYFGIIGDLPAISNITCFKEGGYSKLKRWCMHCFGDRSDVFATPPRTNTRDNAAFIQIANNRLPNYASSFLSTFFGINDCSVFWNLPSFDTSTIFFDFFHTCLEGELKKLTQQIFMHDTREVKYALFTKQDLAEINMIVGNIPMRSDDERLVNFVDRHPYFSGHQMFLWLRLAIPVLAVFLPKTPCNCRIGIRKQIPVDLQQYFGLEATHTYFDHYVGIREYCLFYLRATSHSPLSLGNLNDVKQNLENITRLHILLYGDSFITSKTHVEVAHVVDQFRNQGKPGWLHCFTPERDNRSIKTINTNSTDVFYHLLQISELRKASQLCQASSEDEKIQATGKINLLTFDNHMFHLFEKYYAWFDLDFPENFDFIATSYEGIQLRHFDLKRNYYFQFIRRNTSYIARTQYVILYHGRYWIYALQYKNLGHKDPVTHLPLLQVDMPIVVPSDAVSQQVVVVPSDLRFHFLNNHTMADAELRQNYFLLCTEFE